MITVLVSRHLTNEAMMILLFIIIITIITGGKRAKILVHPPSTCRRDSAPRPTKDIIARCPLTSPPFPPVLPKYWSIQTFIWPNFFFFHYYFYVGPTRSHSIMVVQGRITCIYWWSTFLQINTGWPKKNKQTNLHS